MKFFKSKLFIICLISAVILTLVPSAIALFGGTDLLRSALNTAAKPFTMCASGIANAFNGFTDTFTEYDNLVAENEILKKELEELKAQKNDSEVIKEQNLWLKDYINISGDNPEFVFKDARVISRQSGNYSTVLMLNRGSVHKIKKNMPVLTGDGLLGHVTEVGLDWCKVETVIEVSGKIGVITERGGVPGVLGGSTELRREGLCRMTHIDSTSNIKIGDRVLTAGGEGSIFPSGLLIGSISSVEVDDLTGDFTARITPAVNFNSLSSVTDVLVICGYSTGEGE